MIREYKIKEKCYNLKTLTYAEQKEPVDGERLQIREMGHN